MSLLFPIRIKCISSDVSRHSISCKNLDEKNKNEAGMITFEKITLARMQSIAPHHCGNHNHCRLEYCQHKDIEFTKIATCRLLHDKNESLFNAKISIDE